MTSRHRIRRPTVEQLELRQLLSAVPSLIADLNPTGDSDWFDQLVPVGDKTLMVAGTADTGLEIWQSDGTAANTRLLHDVWPGPPSGLRNAAADIQLSVFRLQADIGGQIAYFTGVRDDISYVWQTDGERLVPVLPGPAEIVYVTGRGALLDIPRETPSGFDEHFESYGHDLFFHDATADTLTYVHSFRFADYDSGVYSLGAVDGLVLFHACDDDGDDCSTWRTDGTFDGTFQISNDDKFDGLFELDGKAYLSQDTFVYAFDGNQATFSQELEGLQSPIGQLQDTVLLWTDRGTEALTSLEPTVERTLLPFLGGWRPQTAWSDGRYYTLIDDQTNRQLWVTDGTVEGTVKLYELQDEVGRFGTMEVADERAYLPVYGAQGGTSLLFTDGTVDGTGLATDLPEELAADSAIRLLRAVDDQLYLVSTDPHEGDQLWVTDIHVSLPPRKLLDPWSGTASTNADQLQPFQDRAVFRVRMETPDHPVPVSQVWITDGTQAGTQRLDGLESAYIGDVFAASSKVFFTEADDYRRTGQVRLWISDGTPQSNVLVSDLVPQLVDASVRRAAVLNDQLVFVTETETSSELWISDGTSGGTPQLTELPGEATTLYVTNDKAHLESVVRSPTGSGQIISRHWYETDGTVSGTREISADEVPDRENRIEFEVDGRRFFVARVGGVGASWWHVQEPDGTVWLIDLEQNADQLTVSNAVLVHDSIYFTAYDRQRKEYQVYELDTAQDDVRFFNDLPVSDDIGRVGASLLVFFNDGFHGNELSSLPLPIHSDVNRDGKTDVRDADSICRAISSQSQSYRYDLNYDDRVNRADLAVLVEDVLQTGPGDANVDRVFESADLIQVFQRGEYEDDLIGNSTWSSGDWNCDGEFDSGDLVLAFQTGHYVAATPPASRITAAADWLFTPAKDAQNGRVFVA